MGERVRLVVLEIARGLEVGPERSEVEIGRAFVAGDQFVSELDKGRTRRQVALREGQHIARDIDALNREFIREWVCSGDDEVITKCCRIEQCPSGDDKLERRSRTGAVDNASPRLRYEAAFGNRAELDGEVVR